MIRTTCSLTTFYTNLLKLAKLMPIEPMEAKILLEQTSETCGMINNTMLNFVYELRIFSNVTNFVNKLF